MKACRASLLVLALCCILAAVLFPQPADAHTIERVSVASDGTQGDGLSWYSSISADGRFVAFQSSASNLVSGDTNGCDDVFVHDRVTGRTDRVSVSSTGTQGNGGSFEPVISADGRFVAFWSEASNLVAGDTNTWGDVFVHDRSTARTEMVSVASDGTQGNLRSGHHGISISADGRFVAFESEATNLVPGDTNNNDDLFVRDRIAGRTERFSLAPDGSQVTGWCGDPSLSADGRLVAFASGAPNLVPWDTNGAVDVFVRDRATGRTERVSVASDGSEAAYVTGAWAGSDSPSISADGRFVAFVSFAYNLAPEVAEEGRRAYVHDRLTGCTELASWAPDGSPIQGTSAHIQACISADGRFVLFEGRGVPTTQGEVVLVRDRLAQRTEQVSPVPDDPAAFVSCGSPSISRDGRFAAYGYAVQTDYYFSEEVLVCDRMGVGGPPTTLPDNSGQFGQPGQGPVYHYPTQLHAHYRHEFSRRLDMTPNQLAQLYGNEGYSFTAATEHWRHFSWDSLFWNRTGAEAVGRICDSFEDTGADHILGIGFNHSNMDLALAGSDSFEMERVRNIQGNGGGLAIAAHPNDVKYPWADWVLDNCTKNASLTGIEIFNAGTYMLPYSWRAFATDDWDRLLSVGKPVWGFAGDDFTNPWPQFDDGCVVIVSPSPTLTTSDAVSALRQGAFYASKGRCLPGTGAWNHGEGAPIIDGWWAEAGSSTVAVNIVTQSWCPVARFVVNGNKAHAALLTQRQDGRYQATYTYNPAVEGTNGYVRAEVYGSLTWPSVSWTQPILIGRLGAQTFLWTPQAQAAGVAALAPVVVDFDQAHLEISQPQSGLAGTVNAYLLAPEDRPVSAPPMGYVGPCYRFLPAAQLDGSNLLRLGYDPREVTLYPEATLSIYWFDPDQEKWTAVPSTVDENAHTVTAAITTLGTFALSAPMPEETNAPGISITSPAPGAVLSGSTTITADAWDDNGVASVQFYLGDLLLDTDVAGGDGWACTFDASRHPPGSYVIAAAAKDACGNEGRAEVSVTLAGGAPGPTLAITSPTAGAKLTSTLAAQGTWSDDEAPLMVIAMLAEVPLPLPVLAEDGTWSLAADISGMTPGSWPLTVSGQDAAGNPVSAAVTVEVPVSLKGQVKARATGADIEGAVVQAYLGGALKAEATTAANGIYQIGALPDGQYVVKASKEHYVVQSKPNITVTAGQTTYVNFNLDVSGRLTGQVCEKGTTTNVEGATVVARSGGQERARTTTGANGIYVMESDLPTGTYVVSVSKTGWVTQTKTNIGVVAGATSYVNFFAFERMPALMGQVRVAGTTTNIPGAMVEVIYGGTPVATATTDANGIYKVAAGLAPWTYRVTASAKGYVRQEKWNVTVTEEQTSYVNFNLQVSGKLKGQVTNKVTGAPIIGATITARSGGVVRATGTSVGPYGVYEIASDLPAGIYTMLCTATGYQDFGRIGIVVTAGNTTYVNFPLSYSAK